MGYREIMPCAPLRAYVDRFWIRHGASAGTHRILPDGCIDVIVELDHGRANAVGAMTTAIVAASTARLAAVRFRPGGAVPFLGVPACELTDRSVALDELDDPLDLARVHDRAPRPAVAALERALLARLASIPSPDPEVAHSVVRLFAPCAPSAAALAGELGCSRQHLRRMLLRHVGLAPKALHRIARLQRAISLLRDPRTALATVALDLGYFDQSHMARDFRLLAGIAPAAAREGSIFPITSLLTGTSSSA